MKLTIESAIVEQLHDKIVALVRFEGVDEETDFEYIDGVWALSDAPNLTVENKELLAVLDALLVERGLIADERAAEISASDDEMRRRDESERYATLRNEFDR